MSTFNMGCFGSKPSRKDQEIAVESFHKDVNDKTIQDKVNGAPTSEEKGADANARAEKGTGVNEEMGVDTNKEKAKEKAGDAEPAKEKARSGQNITANNNQTKATEPKNNKAMEGVIEKTKAASNDLVEKMVSSKAPFEPGDDNDIQSKLMEMEIK